MVSSWASEAGASRAEGAGLAQQPPRHRAVVAGPAAAPALGVEQFQEVAGGHLGERAALGRDEDRCPADGRASRADGADRPASSHDGFRSRANPAGSRPLQGAGQRPGLTPEPASQLSEGRMMSAQTARISPTDSRSSRLSTCTPWSSSHRAQSCFQSGPGVLGAAGQPPLLPGAAGLVRKPGHRERRAAEPPALGAGVTER